MNLYFGIVEDRLDPLKLGRCRVRVVGLHNFNTAELPTSDLPWATPIQPITSAGVSGVGFSPVGLVEGSWVALTFTDEDKQIPLIVGSFGGIPTTSDDTVRQLELGVTQADTLKIKTTQQIKTYTNLVVDTIKSTDTFKEKAVLHEDQYIVGYRTSVINGENVTSDTTLTPDQASAQLKLELDEISKIIVSSVRAPITQSMFDALTLFAHGIGSYKFLSSPVLPELNSGKYENAASQIGSYLDTSNKKRRAIEKRIFLQEGIPQIEESNRSQVTLDRGSTPSNAFNSPTGKYPEYTDEPDTHKLARNEGINSTIVISKESARVTDVAIAGKEGLTWNQPKIPYAAQYPYNHVFATESGHVMEFDDSEGAERIHLYHKAGTFSEVDVNGTRVNRIVGDSYEILERNGFVYIKGSHNVTIEGSHNVKVSGTHSLDIDGVTNINIYNDANVNVSGTANLSVGESLNILAQQDIKMEANNIHIKAHSALNIESDTNNTLANSMFNLNAKASLQLKGDNILNISGNSVNVLSNTVLALQGTSIASLKGAIAVVNGTTSLDLKTGGSLKLQFATAVASPSAGAIDGVSAAPAISAEGADDSGLVETEAKREWNDPKFSELTVPSRYNSAEITAETLEDESESGGIKYRQDAYEKGLIDEDSINQASSSEIVESKIAEKNAIDVVQKDCDLLFGMKTISSEIKLSKYFSVYDMTKKGTRPLRSQNGLSAQEIACNLKLVCTYLDIIKENYPNITITSGWRRPGDAPGSSSKSQHNTGQAVDIVLNGFTHRQVWEAIQKISTLIPYDQLILEYQGKSTIWIHYSIKYSGNRKQAFTMKNGSRGSMEFGKFYLLDGSKAVASVGSSKFDYSITKVLQHEGGYVNNKNDSGGETKYGISKRSYPKIDIKNLTIEDAKAIYYRDFWKPYPFEKLSKEIAYKVFDASVNMGASRGIKLLQRAAGLSETGRLSNVDIDIINSKDQTLLLKKYQDTIAQFYRNLAQSKPKNAQFLKGWLRRAYA